MKLLVVALAALALPSLAHADRAPPPERRAVVDSVVATRCGRGDKDIPCPKEAVAAADSALVAITKALRAKPALCGHGATASHELHMYWGDNFGSVVNVDFDPEQAKLPACSDMVIQYAADSLTTAFKPFGDKDAELHVHWTVAFTTKR